MSGRSRCNCINLIIIILIIIISFPLTSALMGYDINARVNSSTWSIHRSTMNMTFTCDDKVSGSGNFSRSSHLHEAGHSKDESSYSLNGSIDYQEKVRFLAREGNVTIKANMFEYEYPITSDASPTGEPEEKVNVVDSSASIIVDEQWPSAFIDYKSLKYSGSGVRTRDTYYDNGDKVSTSFQSTQLQRESLFQAVTKRMIISALITPEAVKEERNMNKTSTFVLNSVSEGPSVDLEFSRSQPYKESNRFGRMTPDILISEDYSGRQGISLKVGMNESIFNPFDNETQDWLPCCDEPSQSIFDEHMDMGDIINCSCINKI